MKKVIIAQDGVARSLEGDFDMCLSREDALELANTLLRHFHPDHGGRSSYGWVHLRRDHLPPNAEPREWTE